MWYNKLMVRDNMDKSSGVYRVCPAMKRAGIDDPSSKAAIDFCTQRGKYKDSGCPYDRCIVSEAEKSPYTVIRNRRAERAKTMFDEGHSVGEIAVALGKSLRTIMRYLGK